MALGRKTGGRKAGTPNRLTQKTAALAARVVAEGVTPLEVMLKCMHRAYAAGKDDLAVDFAAKAAPFVHPRLSAIELDLKDVSDEDLRDAAR